MSKARVCSVCGGELYSTGDRWWCPSCTDYRQPKMSPEECDAAAATIRDLTERAEKAEAELEGTRADVDAAIELGAEAERRSEKLRLLANMRGELCNLRTQRAEKAEQERDEAIRQINMALRERDAAIAELEALRVETADLREIERCRKSILASGLCIDMAETPLGMFRVFEPSTDNGPLHARVHWEHQWTPECWQSAERAAWEHAATPYRKRIEADGYTLELRFDDRAWLPVKIVHPNGGKTAFGDTGGYPTLTALEEAAAWAEAHSANSSETPNGSPLFRTDYGTQVTIDGVPIKARSVDLTFTREPEATENEPCTCGYEHDGCEGCGYEEREEHQWPCNECTCTETGSSRTRKCRYDPAVRLCCKCGKPRKDTPA